MNLKSHVQACPRRACSLSAVPSRAGTVVLAAVSAALALSLVASAWAQSTGNVPRYDKNGNGRLDPEEVAAMQADQAKAARAPVETTETPSEIVSLSPFEVVDNNRGYYAANTMSGTRINSKIEDLASSITVVTREQMAGSMGSWVIVKASTSIACC